MRPPGSPLGHDSVPTFRRTSRPKGHPGNRSMKEYACLSSARQDSLRRTAERRLLVPWVWRQGLTCLDEAEDGRWGTERSARSNAWEIGRDQGEGGAAGATLFTLPIPTLRKFNLNTKIHAFEPNSNVHERQAQSEWRWELELGLEVGVGVGVESVQSGRVHSVRTHG